MKSIMTKKQINKAIKTGWFFDPSKKVEWVASKSLAKIKVMPTLSVEERLHRIHVLALDLEVAFDEKDYLSIPYITEEIHHYATTNTYATNSGRWETQ